MEIDPNVNIRTVAEKAGVSTAAVSRVLNRKPHVSEAMRAKVMQVCAELGYQLNYSIQDLIKKGRNGKTGNMAYAVVGRYISSPIYVRSLDAMTNITPTFNYNLSLAKISGEESSQYELPPVLRDGRVDGMLLTGDLNEKIVSIIRNCGKPIVILGAYANATCGDLPRVSLDFDATLLEMAMRLKNAGKTRIAFFDNNPLLYANAQAFESYKRALAGAGLQFDEQTALRAKTEEPENYQVLSKAFSGDRPPFDAMICLNHTCAIAASHMIYAHRMLHPETPEIFLATLWPFTSFPLPVPTAYFDLMFEAAAVKGSEIMEDILDGKDLHKGQNIKLAGQILHSSI